jgi:hypothetical protein
MYEGITAVTVATTLASSIADATRTSRRTTIYTPAEEKILCLALLKISTNTICCTEMKGFNYWKKVGKFFHEQRKLA